MRTGEKDKDGRWRFTEKKGAESTSSCGKTESEGCGGPAYQEKFRQYWLPCAESLKAESPRDLAKVAGLLGQKEELDWLRGQAFGSEDARLRAACYWALGKLGDVDSWDKLVEAAVLPDPVGIAALSGCCALGVYPVDRERLLAAIRSGDDETREYALEGFLRAGCINEQWPRFLALLGNVEERFVPDVLEALGRSGRLLVAKRILPYCENLALPVRIAARAAVVRILHFLVRQPAWIAYRPIAYFSQIYGDAHSVTRTFELFFFHPEAFFFAMLTEPDPTLQDLMADLRVDRRRLLDELASQLRSREFERQEVSRHIDRKRDPEARAFWEDRVKNPRKHPVLPSAPRMQPLFSQWCWPEEFANTITTPQAILDYFNGSDDAPFAETLRRFGLSESAIQVWISGQSTRPSGESEHSSSPK